MLGLLSGVTSVLGGLKGLFGSKPKEKTPRDNMLSQAQGARDAAEKYGFNPLTMLQYGQPGGSMSSPGGAPPLASVDMLTSGLKDVNDVVSGDAARRRQAEIMEMDLARIKLEQARSGVIIPTTATDMGGSPAILGRTVPSIVPSGSFRQHGGESVFNGAANVRSSPALHQHLPDQRSSDDGSVSGGLRPLQSSSGLDARRKVENDPIKTHSGFITIDNPHAPFPISAVTMDGDEAVQWYDLPSLAIYGGASGIYHLGKYAGERDSRRFGAGPIHRMEDGQRYQMYDPAKARQNREKKPPSRRRHSLHSLGFK